MCNSKSCFKVEQQQKQKSRFGTYIPSVSVQFNVASVVSQLHITDQVSQIVQI